MKTLNDINDMTHVNKDNKMSLLSSLLFRTGLSVNMRLEAYKSSISKIWADLPAESYLSAQVNNYEWLLTPEFSQRM